MAYTFEEFPDTAYYHSDLREILKRLHEIDAILEDYSSVIQELKDRTEQFDALENRVNALEKATSDLNDIRTKIKYLYTENQDIRTTLEEVKNDITNLENVINNIYTYIEGQLKEVREDYIYRDYILLAKINNVKENLEGEIATVYAILTELIHNLSSDIYNPVHAYRMSFDENNDKIYTDLAYGALTVSEYKELNLTVTEYRKYNRTSRRYYLYGRFDFAKAHWTVGPVSGVRKSISNALNEVVNFFAGTLTSTEYSALNLTVEDYAALNLTVKDYFTYNTNGRGLSVTEYSNINKLNSGLLNV